MTIRYDIVICGGGLVGLLLASLLRRSRYQIALVDAGRAPQMHEFDAPRREGFNLTSGFAPRVSALNSVSVELLERCGVNLPRQAEFKEMRIKDGVGTGHISFEAGDIGLTRLGVVVENHLVQAGLFDALKNHSNLTCLYEKTLEDVTLDGGSGAIVTLADGEDLHASLVVAADGANSRVRTEVGLTTTGWRYDQEALVTTIETQKPHHNIPRQWFTGDGPLAFLPLAESNLSSIVWSRRDAASLVDSDAKAFCAMLTEASESDLGEVLASDRRFVFPLRQQHALRYGRPGVVLLGDAAHAIHPLAGQGANLGFADAATLAEEILDCQLRGEELNQAGLLNRFARRRQPHNLLVASAMEGFKHLYGNDNPLLVWVRKQAMTLGQNTPMLKSLMMKIASGQAI